jgi:hypothetical protein
LPSNLSLKFAAPLGQTPQLRDFTHLGQLVKGAFTVGYEHPLEVVAGTQRARLASSCQLVF